MQASNYQNFLNEDGNIEDGTYLTNHIFHKDGVREREVVIKNNIVTVEKHSFSLSHFFEVNFILKKVK